MYDIELEDQIYEVKWHFNLDTNRLLICIIDVDLDCQGYLELSSEYDTSYVNEILEAIGDSIDNTIWEINEDKYYELNMAWEKLDLLFKETTN